MFELNKTLITRLAGDIEIHERSADAILEYCQHYKVNIDEFITSAVRSHLRYFAEHKGEAPKPKRPKLRKQPDEQQAIGKSAAEVAAPLAQDTSDEKIERQMPWNLETAWARAAERRLAAAGKA